LTKINLSKMSLCLCFLLLITNPLFSGNKPLQLVTSSLDQADNLVNCNPVINFIFSNNVVNMKVSDMNKTCFTLQTLNEMLINIEVIMADDQIEPEKKRIISVKPLKSLSANTHYMLMISNSLSAKNGNTLSNDIKVEFKTGNADDCAAQ